MARENDLDIRVGMDDKFTSDFKSSMSKAEGEVKELKGEFSKVADSFKQDMNSAINDIQGNIDKMNVGGAGGSGGGMDIGGMGGILRGMGGTSAMIGTGIGLAAAGGAMAVNETMRAQREAQVLTQSVGKSNDALRSQLRSITANWQVTQDELLATSNIFTNEFGASAEEAFDIINTGFEKGANVRGEFLEQLKEYSSQLKNIGLNGEEATAVITQFQQQGFFSDKAVDSLKEAGIQLREMTDPTKEALDKLGIDGEKLSQQLQSGSISQLDAIRKVSKRINELGINSTEAQEAVSAIFKGGGEDAGRRLFEVMEGVNGELDDLPDKMTEAKKASNELNEQWDKFATGAFGPDSVIAKGINNFKEGIADILLGLNRMMGTADESDPSKNERLKEINKSIKEYNKILESGDKPGIFSKYAGYSMEDIEKARNNLRLEKNRLNTVFDKNKTGMGISAFEGLDMYKTGMGINPLTVEPEEEKKKKKENGDDGDDGNSLDNETKITGSSQKALTINIEKQIETVEVNGIEDLDNLKEKMSQLLNEIILDVNPVV